MSLLDFSHQQYIHHFFGDVGHALKNRGLHALWPGVQLALGQCSRAPGWLFDIGDYTTQLCGDYNKPV